MPEQTLDDRGAQAEVPGNLPGRPASDGEEVQHGLDLPTVDGFSLHANVALAADDREGLHRLCRYGARQAFSQKQLSMLADGRLRYQLKRPFGPHGQSAIVLEPAELLHRLAALLPPPYLNCTRYFGVFAPHANRRHEVCPGPPMTKRHRHHCAVDQTALPELLLPRLPPSPPPCYRIPWAELLKRTWNADVLSCPRCHGQLKIIAFITKLAVAQKILAHLRLPTELEEPLPARLPPQLDLDLADDVAEFADNPRHLCPSTADLTRSRAPPD